VVLDRSLDMIERVFGLPTYAKYDNVNMKTALDWYEKMPKTITDYINQHLLISQRKIPLKMAKVQHMSEFKEDGKDVITLLSRVFGFATAKEWYPWMCLFCAKIVDGKKIDWGTILIDIIHDQLVYVFKSN